MLIHSQILNTISLKVCELHFIQCSWVELSWVERTARVPCLPHEPWQSPHSDYVTRCYFNLCLQQGSRDDRVSRDVFSFLYV